MLNTNDRNKCKCYKNKFYLSTFYVNIKYYYIPYHYYDPFESNIWALVVCASLIFNCFE